MYTCSHPQYLLQKAIIEIELDKPIWKERSHWTIHELLKSSTDPNKVPVLLIR